jgi:hypothetical protein
LSQNGRSLEENETAIVTTQLAVLQNLAVQLAEVKENDIESLVTIRNKAELVRNYAERVRAGLTVQNQAAELRLRAERSAGKILASMKLRGGDRKSNGHRGRLILADIGISQHQSKRWQRAAAVPEPHFVHFLEKTMESGAELTTAALLRFQGTHDSSKSRGNGDNNKNTAGIPSHSPGQPHTGSPPTDPRDHTVNEALNHLQLLSSILAPVLENNTASPLRTSERRLAKRLISEIATFVKTLRPPRQG